MAATPALNEELTGRGFRNVLLWSRGVDAELFGRVPKRISACLAPCS